MTHGLQELNGVHSNSASLCICQVLALFGTLCYKHPTYFCQVLCIVKKHLLLCEWCDQRYVIIMYAHSPHQLTQSPAGSVSVFSELCCYSSMCNKLFLCAMASKPSVPSTSPGMCAVGLNRTLHLVVQRYLARFGVGCFITVF